MLVTEPAALTGVWVGAGLELSIVACWAAYCVFCLWQGNEAPDVLGRAGGISALICTILHLILEDTILPGLTPLLATIAAGIGPLALGNLAGNRGIRRRDGRVTATMAYATRWSPPCSSSSSAWLEPRSDCPSARR